MAAFLRLVGVMNSPPQASHHDVSAGVEQRDKERRREHGRVPGQAEREDRALVGRGIAARVCERHAGAVGDHAGRGRDRAVAPRERDVERVIAGDRLAVLIQDRNGYRDRVRAPGERARGCGCGEARRDGRHKELVDIRLDHACHAGIDEDPIEQVLTRGHRGRRPRLRPRCHGALRDR